MKAYRPTEAECRRTILDAARKAGWRIHCPRTAMTAKGVHLTADDGDAGWPDVTLIRGDDLVIVELKRAPNTVESEQEKWLDLLARVPGVTAFVLWVPEEQDLFIRALQRSAR